MQVFLKPQRLIGTLVSVEFVPLPQEQVRLLPDGGGLQRVKIIVPTAIAIVALRDMFLPIPIGDTIPIWDSEEAAKDVDLSTDPRRPLPDGIAEDVLPEDEGEGEPIPPPALEGDAPVA